MKIISIGSSSSGNSTLIFNDTAAIILDSGIPVKQILEKIGKRKIDAICISHEHSDHVKTAGALGRKVKAPIYISDLALEKLKAKNSVDFKNCTTINITDTSVLTFGNITIEGFSTKHDAAHALGFIFKDPDTKLCYLTDTGSISKTMMEKIKDCDSFFIECDYDEELMKTFPDYSQDLKDRITSNFGHLSTQQTLSLVEILGITTKRKFIIGHLSQNTNSPDKVWERIKEKFPSHVDKFILAPFNGELIL